MKIERKPNGNIEVVFSYTVMSYMALAAALVCAIGVAYFYLIEDLHIFNLKILGLVLAGVILGIVGIIIYERSKFVFDHNKGTLYWQKGKYFRTKKGEVPFYDITGVRLNRDEIDKKGVIVEILTKQRNISLTDSYVISEDYNVEELVGDLKSITGTGIDVSPKNRALILLDLGQEKSAVDIIREEMDMSMADARRYLGLD
jgi:membrane protein YdbS with pleckstrin-like domain